METIDKTFNKRLEAMQQSPAMDRATKCIIVSYLLHSLACQYMDEADTLMERYMIKAAGVTDEARRLDAAYDRYFKSIEDLFEHSDYKEVNISSQTLYHVIEKMLRDGGIEIK